MEFLSAGVYIQEKKSSAQAVLGVSTSTFATVGWLPRGKVDTPILVGSLSEFLNKFGGYWAKSDVAHAVTGFFKEGGARAYIVRVVPDDAVVADVSASTFWKFVAISPGAWGNLLRVVIQGNANYYDVPTATYSRFDVFVQEESADGAGDFQTVETFEALDLVDDEGQFGILTVMNSENGGSSLVQVQKLAGGIPTAFESTVHAAESIGVGNGGANQTISGTVANPSVAKNTLKVKVDGVLVAQDNGRGVIAKVTGAPFTSVTGTINYDTGAYSVSFIAAPETGDAVTLDYYEAGASQQSYEMTNGADGTAVTRSQVTDSALAADKKGIYALDAIDEMMTIGLPDFAGDVAAHVALLSYCEGRKDCLALVDAPFGADEQGALEYKRITLGSQSSYGAMYYPAVKISNPLTGGRPKVVSNVGHIAGIFARTDSNRNVGKAPAGVDDGALRSVIGLERVLTKAQMDAVYPANINPLKQDPLIGRAVWGCRTLQVSGDFNLVNIRRLFIFLEKSLYNASQGFVFEGLGDELFARVKLTFDGFLGGLCQEGYFASRDPSKSFLVTCDRTNNTPETIAGRKFIADVLVAGQTPGEFALLRFERSLNEIGS